MSDSGLIIGVGVGVKVIVGVIGEGINVALAVELSSANTGRVNTKKNKKNMITTNYCNRYL
jgi:hypothetical protein